MERNTIEKTNILSKIIYTEKVKDQLERSGRGGPKKADSEKQEWGIQRNETDSWIRTVPTKRRVVTTIMIIILI